MVWLLIPFMVVSAMACTGAHAPPDRARVAERLRERTGVDPGSLVPSAETALPPGVVFEDGLSQDEAVATSLWNNPAFHASLAELGFARADLLQAGLLRNPVLSLLLPAGPKQLEATLKWPVEALWQRPRRVQAARLSADAVAERLVQDGLVLVRDVKVAYAELLLADALAGLAASAAELQRRIAEIAQARLRAGDISELEAGAARTDAARRDEAAARAAHEVALARTHLRALKGLGLTEDVAEPPPLTTVPPPADACGALDALLTDALAARPDVRAAELAVEAAGARAGLERSKVLSLIGLLDANSQGREGFEVGPGVESDLPVFDWNQGGRARAAAALEQASREYVEVQHRIAREVREAFGRFSQARELQRMWHDQILPSLDEELKRAERSLAAGESSELFVLELRRRVTDARIRAAEALADVGRGAARLDQAVGRTCASPAREKTVDDKS